MPPYYFFQPDPEFIQPSNSARPEGSCEGAEFQGERGIYLIVVEISYFVNFTKIYDYKRQSVGHSQGLEKGQCKVRLPEAEDFMEN